MSAFDDDRMLTAWLETAAPAREPEHLLPQVLARTAHTRRRPAWLFLSRWLPMDTARARVAPSPRLPIRAIVLVALLSLAIAAAALIAGSRRQVPVPPPFGPAVNGDIVHGTDGQLFVRDELTGTSRLLVDGPNAVGPEFSLDGTRLAWARATGPAGAEFERVEVWVANADGSDPVRLGDDAFRDPIGHAWSPSGDAIAVVESTDTGSRLVLVPTDGGAPTVLLADMDIDAVAWRPPDGAQLVVRGRPASESGPRLLYLVDRDGSAPVALALDPTFTDDLYYTLNLDYYFMEPAWSPDGTRLAFHSLDDVFGPGDGDDPGWRVHVATIGPDGSVLDERTFNADPAIDDEFAPRWLPDGSGLVFNRVEESASSLVVQPLDGAPIEVDLGLPPRSDGLTTIMSPDGSQVLTWMPGSGAIPDQAWSVSTRSGTPTPVDLAVDQWASWQRLAE